jgi:hypothetical protein
MGDLTHDYTAVSGQPGQDMAEDKINFACHADVYAATTRVVACRCLSFYLSRLDNNRDNILSVHCRTVASLSYWVFLGLSGGRSMGGIFKFDVSRWLS